MPKCEMNIAGVPIAEGNIGLSVRRRATVVEVADGQRRTIGNAFRVVPGNQEGGSLRHA
jgi:hypothetical protein